MVIGIHLSIERIHYILIAANIENCPWAVDLSFTGRA